MYRREKTGHEPNVNRICEKTPYASQEEASSLYQEAGTSLCDGQGHEADLSSLSAVNLQKRNSQL